MSALRRQAFQQVVDGATVDLFRLVNARGTEVGITNLGAKIQQILLPDRHGTVQDVVLGYDSIEAVLAGHPSMNAFIGRYANRIGGARFTLDGTVHQLRANNGRHTLHGGIRGSRHQVFESRQLSPRAVEMRYVFGDGEEGFPGTLPVRIVYALGDDDALTLQWSATALDKATVASFTGHAFFNLTGDPRTSIVDHRLILDADEFLPIDRESIPTGKRRGVAGTPMDFRRAKRLGQDIGADDEQLRFANGYDHFFVLRGDAGASLRRAARVEEPLSGRTLEVWTTEPGVQLFSGNSLGSNEPRDVGKDGLRFALRGGLCLEPSRYPDAPNEPGFPSSVLRPGDTYSGRIVYRFGVIQ